MAAFSHPNDMKAAGFLPMFNELWPEQRRTNLLWGGHYRLQCFHIGYRRQVA